MAERRAARWRPILVTGALLAAAAVAAWFLWFHYVHQLWTRDARVRAAVIQVAPDVSGRITAMTAADNSRVAPGDALFSVDPERYQLAVERAGAELELRRQELALRDDEAARRKRLGRAVSSEERESATRLAEVARADLHAAQAALKEARLDLERARVSAPAAGSSPICWPTRATMPGPGSRC